MDNLTHSLVGALIGQAGLKRKTGLAMPALIIGANLPDVDAACFLWLDGLEHLAFRRGITHGPIAWVVLPLILAGGLWWWDRWQTRRGTRPEKRLPVRFGWLYGLAFLATLTHPALDWLNVYGIRLLEPFSSRWFYGDVLFIIDVWLWALLGFATWFSRRREKRGGEWRRPARIAGAVGLAYIGVNAGITADAEADGVRLMPAANVVASPLPAAFWEREVIYYVAGEPLANAFVARADWSVARGLTPYAKGFEGSLFDVTDGAIPERPSVIEDRQLAAFLFWTRAPFLECSVNGSVMVRDARYDDPRARDRFAAVLPDVRCKRLTLTSAPQGERRTVE